MIVKIRKHKHFVFLTILFLLKNHHVWVSKEFLEPKPVFFSKKHYFSTNPRSFSPTIHTSVSFTIKIFTKFRPKKYGFALSKGFFMEKMTQICQILKFYFFKS